MQGIDIIKLLYTYFARTTLSLSVDLFYLLVLGYFASQRIITKRFRMVHATAYCLLSFIPLVVVLLGIRGYPVIYLFISISYSLPILYLYITLSYIPLLYSLYNANPTNAYLYIFYIYLIYTLSLAGNQGYI